MDLGLFLNRRALNTAIKVLREEGLDAFRKKALDYIHRRVSLSHYESYTSWRDHHVALAREWYARNGKPVTIVIPSYNDRAHLGPCLESIWKTTDPARVRVIIVDDKSPDPEQAKYLNALKHPAVTVIRRSENGGFAKCANTGLREANDQDVVLLNSDTIAEPGWLESLQYAAYLDQGAGVVGAKLLYPDGTIQSAGSHRNDPKSPWFDHYYRFLPRAYGPANIPKEVVAVTGACAYIRANVLADIGLLDEGYGMAFEDVDFCLRAREKGHRVLYWPFAELVHKESVTRGKEPGPREKASQEYFWKKWDGFFSKRNVRDAEGRIRVIYVCESSVVAGGHRNIYDQLNRLQAAGFSAELWALTPGPDWFKLDVPVRSFADYPALAAALSGEEAIKVATWWKTAEWVWQASLSKGIPAYLVQDIESSYYANDKLMQDRVLSQYRREFRYVTISSWNAEQLRKLNCTATVVPCGMDRSVYRVLPAETRRRGTILANARANPLKNFAMTLDAWKQMPDRPEFWMYGVEPELALGLSPVKYFEKPSDDEVNRLLNRASCFILTSRHEGFALTILEAMAAGCPVITTDADGNRDFCRDGENCLMVPQDDAHALRAAIERLLGDRDLQERLRSEGFKTAEEFDWNQQALKLQRFFEDLAKPAQARP